MVEGDKPMANIELLDNATIDKIAAGEVVERPASVVKELVENSLDAGAGAITVEIKDGGISLIRVTDNGCGIPANQVRRAFLRHATSKIRSIDDLECITSLGFRGEALSSIAAAARVAIMTKTKEDLLGVRMCLEHAKETEFEEAGLPVGTTILVRQLFHHIPARKKFLKSAASEGSHVMDLCEHLALSHPEVSFRLIQNGQIKLHTSGNGDVKEVIYRLYGRDVIRDLVPVEASMEGMGIRGFLGKPVLNRSNRNFETYFINGRFIKSTFFRKAIEEGYRAYTMQHKFPFVVLYFTIDTKKMDINVHPAKLDVRITDSSIFSDFISKSIETALQGENMIPHWTQEREEKQSTEEAVFNPQSSDTATESWREPSLGAEPFEEKRRAQLVLRETMNYQSQMVPQETDREEQIHLFDEKPSRGKKEISFQILGQLFQTYWIISLEDQLLFVDQHAAHEKVKYERLLRQSEQGEVFTQMLEPPLIVHLTGREEGVLAEYGDYLADFGFQWETFGGQSIAIRTMPTELFGKSEFAFFREILDELAENGPKGKPEVIRSKIASMACKAAVKGNQMMHPEEMEALLHQLFTLENPYHCPHGRPTMISMSRLELEKKFKRVAP